MQFQNQFPCKEMDFGIVLVICHMYVMCICETSAIHFQKISENVFY